MAAQNQRSFAPTIMQYGLCGGPGHKSPSQCVEGVRERRRVADGVTQTGSSRQGGGQASAGANDKRDCHGDDDMSDVRVQYN